MTRIAAFALVVVLAGCGGSPERPPEPARPSADRLTEIEDARDADAPELATAAAASDPALRARAALAMGRMLKAQHVRRLLTLSADANAIVRRTAVWALGQYGFLGAPPAGEREIVDGLRPRLADTEESVRAAAAEAVGKMAGAEASALLAPLLRDGSANVKAAAAWGCMIWKRLMVLRRQTPPAMADAALEGLIALAGDADPRLRARAAYALWDTRASTVLARLVQDPDVDVRFFAARRARELKLVDVLASAQRDEAAVVRIEAVNGLWAEAPDRIDPAAATDSSYHVRAYAALGGRAETIEALQNDASPAVRAAALKGRVRLQQAEAKPHLMKALGSSEWVLREGAVEAAGMLGESGLGIVQIALDDPHPLVRAAAATTAVRTPGARSLAIVRGALARGGLAERGAIVDALAQRAGPESVTLAREAYALAAGREFAEVRETAVTVAAADKSAAVTEWLRDVVANDPETPVRRRAWTELTRRGVADVPEPPPGPMTHTPHRKLRFAANPLVVLETTRGTMVIECFAADAPSHVANFVGLVRERFYDGLTWHRVVPNFVIQGGDPAGTGMGGPGWALRAEINDRRYERGTVGMPRTPDFDTGGCQLFVTHVPTPQLDAQYTVFGRVIEGLDVVDRIERGDRIVRATVRE